MGADRDPLQGGVRLKGGQTATGRRVEIAPVFYVFRLRERAPDSALFAPRLREAARGDSARLARCLKPSTS